MNINKLIIETLKPLNIPIARLKYIGNAETYIVFQEYLEQGEGFSDDGEEITGRYIQINIFSKTDYTSLVNNVKTSLIGVGFMRTSEYEIYENDTGFYNKIIRFKYNEYEEVI